MKKRLDTETITNELKGASLFFQRARQDPAHDSPAPVPPPVLDSSGTNQDSPRHVERIVTPPLPEGTPVRGVPPEPPVRPVRRHVRRHAFDIYDDQLDSLRKLAMTERISGGLGSMSQMVREALDRYIKERGSE